MDLNRHEPAPVRGNNQAVWPEVFKDMDTLRHFYPYGAAVLTDMRARDVWGIDKHGGPLVVGDGRRDLVDVYQEILDASVYSKKALLSANYTEADQAVISDIYIHLLEEACEIRRLIEVYYGGEL